MTEKNMFTQPPEKVALMYGAVMELINEGADVNAIKVSDITGRAGIGKGTAYEYFSSKEEIMTNAVIYDAMKKREQIIAIVDGDGSFAEKVNRMFDFIADKFEDKRMFCMLVRIGTGSYEISELLKREYERMQVQADGLGLEQLCDRLMEQGIKEGVIREPNRCFRRMAFGAQVIAIAVCLVAEKKGKNVPVSVEQAKAFAYESLVKSLS